MPSPTETKTALAEFRNSIPLAREINTMNGSKKFLQCEVHPASESMEFTVWDHLKKIATFTNFSEACDRYDKLP